MCQGFHGKGWMYGGWHLSRMGMNVKGLIWSTDRRAVECLTGQGVGHQSVASFLYDDLRASEGARIDLHGALQC